MWWMNKPTKKKTLVETFPLWTNNGIFKTLYDRYQDDIQWLSEHQFLDIQYYGNHSGAKSISPLIEKFLDEDGELPQENQNKIADVLYSMFNEKWQHLYAILQAEYNPIENYSMFEKETPNIVRTEKASSDYALTDEQKTQTNLQTTTNQSNTASAFGFNSDGAVDLGDSSTGSTSNVSGSGDDNVVTNTRKQSGEMTNTETGSRDLRRYGNIGVTTTQQMLNQELEFWKWTFFDSIFKDVDAILTINYYNY